MLTEQKFILLDGNLIAHLQMQNWTEKCEGRAGITGQRNFNFFMKTHTIPSPPTPSKTKEKSTAYFGVKSCNFYNNTGFKSWVFQPCFDVLNQKFFRSVFFKPKLNHKNFLFSDFWETFTKPHQSGQAVQVYHLVMVPVEDSSSRAFTPSKPVSNLVSLKSSKTI